MRLAEIPLWLKMMGGRGVIKVPYSNAGQGVFTITSEKELEDFLAEADNTYDKYIVQSLVGNSAWSSVTRQGHFYHVGTIPNKKNEIFVADIRMMVASTPEGFRPIAVYARRAHDPLEPVLKEGVSGIPCRQLGTIFCVEPEDGSWSTEANRLLLMDRKDFNQVGAAAQPAARAAGGPADCARTRARGACAARHWHRRPDRCLRADCAVSHCDRPPLLRAYKVRTLRL